MNVYLSMFVAYVFECPDAGNFEDVCDCRRFFQCNNQGANPVAVPCAAGTVYNAQGVCNWDWAEDINVVCATVSAVLCLFSLQNRFYIFIFLVSIRKTIFLYQISPLSYFAIFSIYTCSLTAEQLRQELRLQSPASRRL